MATIYNIAGTTSKTFQLGNGTTLIYGPASPTNKMGKPGDIYIQINKEIPNVETAEEIDDLPPHPGVNTVVKWVGPTNANYKEGYYYKWNGSSWVESWDGKDSLGRVWYKEKAKNPISGVWEEKWSFIKTYSFDEQIIHAIETGDYTNDFFISLEYADNSNIVTSTKANDYEKNHSAYGVTRFAIASETYANGSGVDKFIVETPAQIKADIGVEKTRAQGVEGNLSQLKTTVKTNLVNAINSEHDERIAADADLQEQITTLASKTDVVDIVGTYQDLQNYDTTKLNDNDIIKVLNDSTHANATSYYRWNKTTSTWSFVGSVESYYTTIESDSLFVHKTGDETITGTKFFQNRDLYIKSDTLDRTDTTQTGFLHLAFKDKNNKEMSHVKSTLDQGKIITSLGVTYDASTNAYSGIEVIYDPTTDTVTSTTVIPPDGDSSRKIATTDWISDPTKSTNVVHRSGTETITGNKTFNGTVIVQTPTENSHAATKKYVDDIVSSQTQIPSFGPSDAYSCLAVSQSGNSLYWRPVQDITKLNELDDTVVSNPTNGQTLIWDSSAASGAGAWINSNQVSATIKYW